MATKHDELRRQVGSYFPSGEPAEGQPAEPEAPTAARQAERLPGDGPPIIASPKSHTSSGRLLRRTTYFTPAEWGAILAAAEAETRETGERVTAAEIIRRAVWAYLVKDLDA